MNAQVIIATVLLTTMFSTIFVFLINFKNRTQDVKKLNFRSVSIQLLSLTAWVAILANVFFPRNGHDPSTDLALFLVSVVVGVFLIRNIFREIKSQEDINKMIDRIGESNQKLRILDKQKTEFVSIASHQLRSPLSAIKGYTAMILDGDFGNIPENLKEPLQRIARSSNALNFLINDFLNVSRIEKGELEYSIEEFNVVELLNDICDDFKIVAENQKLIIRKKYDQSAEIIMRADAGKVRQIVSNLIDNAIKYTYKGYIEVDMKSDNNSITISVKDTGVGISEEMKLRIFEKFSRSEEALKMNVSGSGLGLFVAKIMTEAHNGDIWVESEGVGKGSTFFIKLPIKTEFFD